MASSITGEINRVIYYHPDTNYAVIRVTPDAPHNGGNEKNTALFYDDITCVGTLPAIREGDKFSFTGTWRKHPKFGRQFAFEQHELILPKSRDGIITYLVNTAYGIGPMKAGKIVDTLGEDCLDIIRENPDKLLEVPGVKPEQAEEITGKLTENAILAELTSLICRQGVTANLALKIYQQYGHKAIAAVKENPYILADDMYGVGFKVADRVAQSTGVKPDSPYRIEAAISYVLKDAGNEGHVFLPPGELCRRVRRLLGKGVHIPGREIQAAVKRLAKREVVVVEVDGAGNDVAVYAKGLYDAEVELAEKVRVLMGKVKGEE